MKTLSIASLAFAAAILMSPAAWASGIPLEAIFSVRDTDGDGRGDAFGQGYDVTSSGGVEQRVMLEFRNPYSEQSVLDARGYVQVVPLNAVELPRAFELSAYIGDGAESVEDYQIDSLPPVVIEPELYQWELEIDLTEAFQAAAAAGSAVAGIRVRVIDADGRGAEVVGAWATVDVPWPCPTYCPCDYDQSGGVDGDDISAFAADWYQGAPCADFDQSGGIDVDDFAFFMEMWVMCCC